MKGGLVQLVCLKRLDVGKVFSGLVLAFIFARGTSRPHEVGLDGVNVLFPVATFPFEVAHSKSQDDTFRSPLVRLDDRGSQCELLRGDIER